MDLSKRHWVVVAVAVVLLVIFVAIGFGVSASSSNMDVAELDLFEKSSTSRTSSEDGMARNRRESILGNYSKAAVASDGGGAICSQIGRYVRGFSPLDR